MDSLIDMAQAEVLDQELQVSFRETVLPGQGILVEDYFTFAGKITQVMMSFPPGCNNLVLVRLLKDRVSLYPKTGFLAFDNASPVYPTYIDYYAREPLGFEVQNQDAANSHTISCTVVLRFKKPSWY